SYPPRNGIHGIHQQVDDDSSLAPGRDPGGQGDSDPEPLVRKQCAGALLHRTHLAARLWSPVSIRRRMRGGGPTRRECRHTRTYRTFACGAGARRPRERGGRVEVTEESFVSTKGVASLP